MMNNNNNKGSIFAQLNVPIGLAIGFFIAMAIRNMFNSATIFWGVTISLVMLDASILMTIYFLFRNRENTV
jgi:hypothetical protein